VNERGACLVCSLMVPAGDTAAGGAMLRPGRRSVNPSGNGTGRSDAATPGQSLADDLRRKDRRLAVEAMVTAADKQH
jgi:hypothetical protein